MSNTYSTSLFKEKKQANQLQNGGARVIMERERPILKGGRTVNRSITLPKAMRCYPSVYAFRDFYRIFACFNCPALVWVRVGEKTYYDHSNGVLRSNSPIHSVEVPMEELDRAREYTVCYRKIIERKVYYPTSEDTVEVTFAFRPVTGYPIRIYQLSDVHNLTDVALRAGVFWGDDIDLLIFNGDLPDHCASIERLEVIYDLASAITHGEVPVIFSRGNHDLRGSFAEHFSENTPTAHGLPYFTFRLGPIWGMAAGFLHMSIVQNTSYLYGGLNLYNNGFAAGLTCIIMIPLIEALKTEPEE